MESSLKRIHYTFKKRNARVTSCATEFHELSESDLMFGESNYTDGVYI